ncbi:hypothetical protein [Deinococcus sp. PEB2-67]
MTPAPTGKVYTFARPGPDADQPWTVTAGMVVVVLLTTSGTRASIVCTPGSTWPGLATLNRTTLGQGLTVDRTRAVGDAHWTEGGSTQAGVAHVTSQLVRLGSVDDRLRRTHTLIGTLHENHETLAAVIDTTRETTTNRIGHLKHTRPELF